MKNRKSNFYHIIIIVGVVVLVNILSGSFFTRLDFTQDKRYTLSDATTNLLKDLKDPVTITAYFTEDLPPVYKTIKNDFKDLLIEYGQVSHGMVVYEFVDPGKDQQQEQEAMQQGVQPLLINMREKDQVKQQKAFLGAVIQMGEGIEVIPFLQQTAEMEYALSSSIKKLAVTEKPSVAFLQGHGEPSLSALPQAKAQLDVLYNVRNVQLSDTANMLATYNTLVIVGPSQPYSDFELQQIEDFQAGGGKIVMALNRVEGDFQSMRGNAVETGLEKWLSNKGIIVESDFVVDNSCASVGVRQQQGGFSFNTQMPFHYLPRISDFADHPISKGLEDVVFSFASSITYTGDSTLQFLPIVMSSESAGTRPSPVYFDIQKKWTKNDFPLSNLTLGAVITGKLAGDNPSSMVVFGDADFAVNGLGQQARQISADNISLLVNSIDWLSDDTGLITLRTKGVTSRPIREIDEAARNLLKWLNFILPIFLIIVYGIIRRQRKNVVRVKRMEIGYVK